MIHKPHTPNNGQDGKSIATRVIMSGSNLKDHHSKSVALCGFGVFTKITLILITTIDDDPSNFQTPPYFGMRA
jgi:hypothetical protein